MVLSCCMPAHACMYVVIHNSTPLIPCCTVHRNTPGQGRLWPRTPSEPATQAAHRIRQGHGWWCLAGAGHLYSSIADRRATAAALRHTTMMQIPSIQLCCPHLKRSSICGLLLLANLYGPLMSQHGLRTDKVHVAAHFSGSGRRYTCAIDALLPWISSIVIKL